MPARSLTRKPATRALSRPAGRPADRPADRAAATTTGGTPPESAATAAAAASERDDARPSDVSADLYVASSEVHGLGMFAARRLRKDVVLGRLAGMPTYDDGTYVLWLTDELGLEVTNDFRFINHSKTPNCALTDVDVVTLRAIGKHEELTHDYGWT